MVGISNHIDEQTGSSSECESACRKPISLVTPGDHLYYNLYIIRVHENDEKGSFCKTNFDP